MRFLLLLPIIALLASCAAPTHEPTPPSRHSISYERPDAAPSAANVGRASGAVRSEADALRGQVGILRREASEARGAADRAGNELTRLVAAKSATEADLTNLQTLFSDTQRRNLFLETETERLAKSHDNLKTTIAQMETAVEAAAAAAIRADEGKAEALQTIEELQRENQELRARNGQLAQAAAKAEVSKASAGPYKILVWAAIIIGSLLIFGSVGLWIFLKIYKPPTPW
jgi:DNA repair exonuclease SbcCD ATPase subunit